MTTLVAAAGGVAAAAQSLWGYNQSLWLYDKNARQNREHQAMNLRMSQASLYREDLRDLFGLTTTKMGDYMLVNTLQLGFCISLFYDGRLEVGVPRWIFWLHTLSLGAAMVYLVLSLWFSVYASIASQSQVVRVLTQVVRLPVPSDGELLAAQTFAATYELDVESALRVPFLCSDRPPPKPAPRLAKPPGSSEGPSPLAEGSVRMGLGTTSSAMTPHEAMHLPHVAIFRALQRQWRGYDSYARVCMTLGTYHLLQTLMYFSMAYFQHADYEYLGSLMYVLIFLMVQYLLVSLEIVLNFFERFLLVSLMCLGPLTAWVAGAMRQDEMAQKILVPIVFGLHFLHMCLLLLHVCETWYANLVPRKFRSVVYLDIFNEGDLSIQGKKARLGKPIPKDTYTILGDDGEPLVEATAEHEATLEKVSELRRWFALFSYPAVGEYLDDNRRKKLEQFREAFEDIESQLKSSSAGSGWFGRLDCRDVECSDGSDGEDYMPMTKVGPEEGWIQIWYLDSEFGSPRPYWYRPRSGDIAWDRPRLQVDAASGGAPIEFPSLPTLEKNVILLQQMVDGLPTTASKKGSVKSTASRRSIGDIQADATLADMEGLVEGEEIGRLPLLLFQKANWWILTVWLVAFVWTFLYSFEVNPFEWDYFQPTNSSAAVPRLLAAIRGSASTQGSVSQSAPATLMAAPALGLTVAANIGSGIAETLMVKVTFGGVEKIVQHAASTRIKEFIFKTLRKRAAALQPGADLGIVPRDARTGVELGYDLTLASLAGEQQLAGSLEILLEEASADAW